MAPALAPTPDGRLDVLGGGRDFGGVQAVNRTRPHGFKLGRLHLMVDGGAQAPEWPDSRPAKASYTIPWGFRGAHGGFTVS